MNRISFTFLIWIFWCSYSLGSPHNLHYDMNIDIDNNNLDQHQDFTATINVNWKSPGEHACFYLAFNDPYFYWDPSQDFHRSMNKNKAVRPRFGSIEIVESTEEQEGTGSIYQIKNKGHVSFRIKFQLPRWKGLVSPESLLFYQFYPQKLVNCPNDDSDHDYLVENGSFKANIEYPSAWSLVTPFLQYDDRIIEGKGKHFSFSLSKHPMRTVSLGGIDLVTQYSSDFMKRYADYFIEASQVLIKLIGMPVFHKLILIESDNLERATIPGYLILNRPRQSMMSYIQNKVLNWGAWQVVTQLCRQWFGMSLGALNRADAWLMRGTADFYAGLILQESSLYNDLFQSDNKSPWLSFTYRQSSDFIASLLGVVRPENALTTDDLESKSSIFELHNFSYIRHTMALRFAYWYNGESFLFAMKDFYSKFRGKLARPKQLLSFLSGYNIKPKTSNYIAQWWSNSSWPDFAIDDVQDLGADKTKITISQNSSFQLPYDLKITSSSGNIFTSQREPEESVVVVPIEEAKIEQISINPGREIYDQDRFNNTNDWPGLVFFPGNAKTIRDDAYTVVWLPYPAKLPGQEFSLMLSAQLLKYVKSGLSLMLSYIPSSSEVGFLANYIKKYEDSPWVLGINAADNYGYAMQDQRAIELSFTNNEPLPFIPGLSLGVWLRYRGEIDNSDSLHGSFGSRLSYGSRGFNRCPWAISANSERSINSGVPFSYHRTYAVASWGCQVGGFKWNLRGFSGHVKRRGDTPAFVQFNPQNLDEARLRIDRPSLISSDRINSASLDIDIPAILPIPSFLFLLPKYSSWRLFYDQAWAEDSSDPLKDYGVGFTLPLGGDVVGKRSLSLARLTILAVLYKEYQGESSREPGILIDFMGKI